MKQRENLALYRPTHTVRRFIDIDLAHYRKAGKKLLILDAEGTFVNHHDWNVKPEIRDQIYEAGFPYVVVASNNRTRNAETFIMTNWWAYQVCAGMALTPQDKNEKKPGPYMLQVPMQYYGVTPAETLMLGDKLTKDIQAANLAGVESIWIRQHTGEADQPSDRYYRRIIERSMYWQQRWQEFRGNDLWAPGHETLVQPGGRIVFETVDPALQENVPEWRSEVPDPLWEQSRIVNYGGRIRAMKHDWPPVVDPLASPRLQMRLDAWDNRSLRIRARRHPGVNEQHYAEAVEQLLSAAA